MKKKKVIIGSCVITVALVATLGSVFVLGSSDNENKNKNNETVVENNETTENVMDNEFIEDNTDGYKVETESGKIEDTDYTAMAIAKYKEIGSQLTIPEDTYVSEYLELIKNGSTPEKAEEHLLNYYKVKDSEEETTSNTSSGNSSEQSTEKPAEKPVEKPTQPSTEKPTKADPFKLETSGKYKDSKIKEVGTFTYYLRTFDNGAQRYVLHVKDDDILDKYYYVDDIDVVPKSVLDDIAVIIKEYFSKKEQSTQNLPVENPTTSQKTENNDGYVPPDGLGSWDNNDVFTEVEMPDDWYEEIGGADIIH